MNRTYSIVWNSSRQAWVVASELARGHGFVLAKKTLLVLTVASTIGNAFAQNVSSGVVSNGVVSSGETQVVYSNGQTSNATVNSGGIQNVNNGGKTTSTKVNSSGAQNVGNSGTAISTIVSSGGIQRVNSGGTATGTKLSGGNQNIYSGGKASATEVYAGGTQTVYLSGTASSTKLSGGTQNISSGGKASATEVYSGGKQNIYAEGHSENAIINNGGNQYIYSNGEATGATVNTSGFQRVSAGGIATGTKLSGGTQNISSGGKASATEVFSGGKQNISADGIASGTRINQSGYVNISSGGYAESTIINSGGTQSVLSNGLASGTMINNSGRENVSNGGASYNAIINDGGNQYIYSNGEATGATVNTSGFQRVSAGGTATGTKLSGGTQNVSSGGSATGTVVNSSGTQNIYSAGNAIIATINSSGTQNILSGGTASATVVNTSGFQRVSAGGIATGTKLSGGNQNVSSGGSAIAAEVYSGGKQTVYAGGVASGTQIFDGGMVNVSGGTVSGASVNLNGRLNVYAGNVTGTILNKEGRQYIRSGASATSTVANTDGREYVLSGGVADGTVVNSGGLQAVSGGGSASSTVINEGGSQFVYEGGNVSGTVIKNGGAIRVDAGASALNIALSSGGNLFTSTGATVTGTNHYGSFSVSQNHASNVVLENGGLLAVTSGSTATDTTVNSAGRLRIDEGGTLDGTTTINADGIVAGAKIKNDGDFILNLADDYDFNTELSGNGALVKDNSGVMSYEGTLTQARGVNVKNGGIILGSAVVNADMAVSQNAYINISDQATINGSVNNKGSVVINNSIINGNITNDADLSFGTAKLLSATVNGSLVNNKNIILNPTKESAGNTLTVSNYTGTPGSVISLGGVLEGDNSLTDRLVVKGNTSGQSDIVYVNEGGSGGQTIEGINIISVEGNSDAAFSLKNRVVAGAYDYTLQKGNVSGTDNKGWYLTSHLPTSDTRQYRPENGSYAANMALANSLFLMDLNERKQFSAVSDNTQPESASVWMKITGGRTSGKLSDGQNKTTTNQFINQLGGDIYKYHAEKLGDFTLGIMGGYANAKGKTINHTSKKGARNTLDGYSAGLYGTWYQNGANATGLFAETWMQYNWFNASVKGDGLEEEKYNLNGLTASVGGGYNLNVHTWTSPEGIKGEFWLQPHLQAVWMGVTPDTHQEDNGTVVQGTGKNNLQTKAGIRASWKVKSSLDKDTGREFRPYIEANWLHNTHEFGVKMSGDNQLLSGSRNQGEIKTGIEGVITQNLSVNGGVAYQAGGHGSNTISGALGIKYSF
ncbi:autotransporter adhesin AIDA-I [Escherichia coli]|uniref:autotransporter adhesin AIDA-I n=1 Tax=Escherichia coli TaxID=562 RepID=UPI000DD791BA|nr:autotransporter adhesin AIDA-I [Escherichia coli]EFQ3064179.1 autotransporter adhesin AIDA-I [Escherichia coli]EKP6447587.1 autotransporter adhesin AIDA-I [Escherichia coli]EKT8819394.1 autotransporter adhesin AIDA-I [Escherichia coli]MCL7936126.1 autotransporter adhesin AIDA-I [Escherichia coli]MDS1704698.1 autotransporter adhesin AIDA-I [Escherichia coli]